MIATRAALPRREGAAPPRAAGEARRRAWPVAPARAPAACACGGGCPRCAGRPLDGALRRRMESGLGTSLEAVRIHTDAQAAMMTAQRRANALTLGEDIHFAPGRFAPHRADGARRLAHELVHVVQQRAGQEAGRADGSAGTESEARTLGAAVAAGARVLVRGRAPLAPQAEGPDPDGTASGTPQLQLDPEIERLMLQHTLRWWLGSALVLGDAPTRLPAPNEYRPDAAAPQAGAEGPVLPGPPLAPDLFAPLPPDPLFLEPDAGALFGPFTERGAPVGPGDHDAVMSIYRRNAAIASRLPDLRSIAPGFLRPLIPGTWRRDIAGALTGAAVGASLKHDYMTPIEVSDRAFEAMTGASTTVIPLPAISFDLL